MQAFAQKPKATRPTKPARRAMSRMERFGHSRDFSQSAVHAGARATVQGKLRVNTPGDTYEREADRISDQVMRMPEPQLLRLCPCGGGCPGCETQQPGQKHERLQMKHAGSSDMEQLAVPSIVDDALRSSGQPLDSFTRAFMEPRFGHDFSNVRVHSDERGAKAAKALQARAFVAGQHAVFATGQFAPRIYAGQKLLAHELAHVVQLQTGPETTSNAGAVTRVFRQVAGSPGGPDPCQELVRQIIELLDEVARRFNDALDDPHDLFRDYPNIRDPHEEHGSWEGHRRRYERDTERLRQKIDEWDNNDNCRGYRLSRQQQEELNEARDFAAKEFPARPLRVTREAYSERSPAEQPVLRRVQQVLFEVIRAALIAAGIVLTAAAIAIILACLSGPCEVAALIGALGYAGAMIVLVILRTGCGGPSAGGSTADVNDGTQSDTPLA